MKKIHRETHKIDSMLFDDIIQSVFRQNRYKLCLSEFIQSFEENYFHYYRVHITHFEHNRSQLDRNDDFYEDHKIFEESHSAPMRTTYPIFEFGLIFY